MFILAFGPRWLSMKPLIELEQWAPSMAEIASFETRKKGCWVNLKQTTGAVCLDLGKGRKHRKK